jgi:hypothetical protein
VLGKKPQQRGYEFEKLIFEFLEYENLSPSPPYRQQGEQIDGLFEFENRFYLLAKLRWASQHGEVYYPYEKLLYFKGEGNE